MIKRDKTALPSCIFFSSTNPLQPCDWGMAWNIYFELIPCGFTLAVCEFFGTPKANCENPKTSKNIDTDIRTGHDQFMPVWGSIIPVMVGLPWYKFSTQPSSGQKKLTSKSGRKTWLQAWSANRSKRYAKPPKA